MEYWVFEHRLPNGKFVVRLLPGDRFHLKMTASEYVFQEVGYDDQEGEVYKTPAGSYVYAAKDMIIAFTKAKEITKSLDSKGVLQGA